MKTWQELEAYNNGAIFSRLNGSTYQLDKDTYVLCTIPRLFTPHCANELKAADSIYSHYLKSDVSLVFGSTDSPEVAEQYFGNNPVSFPFIRINSKVEYDLGAIDRFGDAKRATYFIKDGKVKEVEVYDFDSERDMGAVFKKAKEILA